ncbi:helix-turn-helix transcriptional regulator [Treponema primitia]|uniref:helix-turn-helix transcriptional regulator n=1 Tax=Treponema primitia TaxID=88058 RepID=UPI000474BA73|nr:hypothetical protein [Treponema primitia]
MINITVPKFITMCELCAALSVSRSTAIRGMKAGIAPFSQCFRLGRKILCPVSALQALENAASVEISKADVAYKNTSPSTLREESNDI